MIRGSFLTRATCRFAHGKPGAKEEKRELKALRAGGSIQDGFLRRETLRSTGICGLESDASLHHGLTLRSSTQLHRNVEFGARVQIHKRCRIRTVPNCFQLLMRKLPEHADFRFPGFFVSVFYCFLNGEVRSAVRKRWHRWQDNHALRVRVARAMSIPTSPTRISFHSIKQTTAV
uniref:Corticotropin releasing hormone receptor 2 n=1 Tax=Nothobranchius korthausae TaxID=1143690 RepID=A0A1A8G5C7_9TELE